MHDTSPGNAGTGPSSKRYKWWVVGMLWFVCFFNYADRQAMYSVFPAISAEYGFSKLEMGLIGSAFMWVYAFGAPVAGFIGDRVKRVHLILGGCLFWSGVTVLTGWCGQLWQFITVRALEGLGETFYFPASMSLVSDYHGRRTRSRAFAIHQSSVYIGTIAGSWLAAWLAEHYGWRWGFYIFGAAGVLLSVLLYRFLREPVRGAADRDERAADQGADLGHGMVVAAPDEKPPGVGEVARIIFRKPTVWMLMGAFLCANFVATIFLTWTPTFLVEKFGFKLTEAGLSGSIFIHLASALSVPLGGIFADRLVRSLAGGRMLIQAAGLLIGSVFVVLVGSTANVTLLLVSMGLFGFCKGFYDANIFASLFDFVEPRARGTAAGIMNTVGWGGGALGPIAVGLAASYGGASEVENMSAAIAWCGAVYLVAVALLVIPLVFFVKRDLAEPVAQAA